MAWHGGRHAGNGRRGTGVLSYGEEDKGEDDARLRELVGCFGWAKKEREKKGEEKEEKSWAQPSFFF